MIFFTTIGITQMNNNVTASVIPDDPRLYHHADPKIEDQIKETEQLLRDALEKVCCKCECCDRVIPPEKTRMEKVLCRCEKIFMIPAEAKTTEKRKRLLAAALLAGTLMTALIVLIVVLVKYA